jgi:hypothetical protein
LEDRLILSPTAKVLSTIQANGVECLLMGGQACILYGAAEFSRDADFAVLASPDNLQRLRAALRELKADVIAVPPFEPEFLERGHAVHFRCQAPGAEGMRLDVMSRLRGVAPFEELFARRTTWSLAGDLTIHSLALPDLVASKKTQRDKDWPMIRRLVEVSYGQSAANASAEQVAFWFRELRTVEILIDAVDRFPSEAREAAPSRDAVRFAIAGDRAAIETAMLEEEARERELDRAYWTPLKAELESLRRHRTRGA